MRESLLALLGDRPKHGYQLKLEFDEATRDAWPLNVGQVYTTLHRLERDGLVVALDADDEGRRMYQRTAAGAQASSHWFSDPLPGSIAVRDEVSMKLLVALVAPGADVVSVIDRQRDATMSAVQDYTRLKKEAHDDDVAWMLHLDRLIFQAEAELKWLTLTEERVTRQSPRIVSHKPSTTPVKEGTHD